MNIRKVREKLGVNQTKFAEILGLGAYTRISEYENGRKPSKQVLILLVLLEREIITPAILRDVLSKIELEN